MATTRLYNEVATMKEFNITPAEWAALPRTRKKVLKYHRVMQHHYEATYQEEIAAERKKKQAEAERERRIKNKMPTLRR